MNPSHDGCKLDDTLEIADRPNSHRDSGLHFNGGSQPLSVSHGIRLASKSSVVKKTTRRSLVALSALILGAGHPLASQPFPGADETETRETVHSGDFEVTDGAIQSSHNRLLVESPEMRAVIRSSTIHHKAEVNFAYLGPTSRVSKLANGEVRHQFGLKLRAQDVCNLVYVMWNFDSQKVAVSVKLNPGQRTHEQCLDHGYINDIKPDVKADPPALQIDEPHTLAADLDGRHLNVTADSKVVWRGTLPLVALQFDGPVGLRSDNARVVFDYSMDQL
jgi:hypothetical protein